MMTNSNIVKDQKTFRAYLEDRDNVFGDPNRFGLASIITYLHQSDGVTIDYLMEYQKKIDMNLLKDEIEEILDDWIKKKYVTYNPHKRIKATKKMIDALKKDGVTPETLSRFADFLDN